MDTINLTEESLKELRRLYGKAKPGEVFLFQGKEILKEYAKYVIQYAEEVLGLGGPDMGSMRN